MTRLFIDSIVREHSDLELTGDKFHYLSVVLRSVPGDTLIITGADGSSFHARIASFGKRTAHLDILDRCEPIPEPPLGIVLFQALLKGEKMDLVIQKSTELGVSQVVPVITERSLVRGTRKLQRWRKIAEEAARQCGRVSIPDIAELQELPAAVKNADASSPRVIFWEQGGEPFSAILGTAADSDRIILFTGPEGGFSEAEVSVANSAGFRTASLGQRILRAETAAIAAVSITQYVLGDLSCLQR
ncbi:MAG TPA: 16S rRNA (uracil(1498)-N(3))-methyltransferase [Thermodesulfovibrionales bacterium]|nr:16S rRNA (uracil(1498)-N(3))-methyltransferase [Thermodesulfovibrionales bacterium]